MEPSPREILTMIGSVTLRDVLLNTVRPPFDLPTFLAFAREEYSDDHINFWVKANALYTAYKQGQDYSFLQCLNLVRDYFRKENSLNIDSCTRINITHVAPVSPTGKDKFFWPKENREAFFTHVKTALDSTYHLIESNTWRRYCRKNSISARLHFAREIALWCYDYPDKPSFCSYPQAINRVEFQFVAVLEALLLIISLCFDWLTQNELTPSRWTAFGIYSFLLYSVWVRVFCGPRLCPLSLLVIFCLQPTFDCCEDEFIPGPPCRCHQITAGLSLIGLLIAFFLWPLGGIIIGCLCFLHAVILAVIGWSWAGSLFLLCVTKRVVPMPDEITQSCQARYIHVRSATSHRLDG